MNGEIDEEMSDPGNTCFVGNSRNITQKTYICNPGYMFPDGDETFEIRCGINRRWIPSMPPNCEREQTCSLMYCSIVGTSNKGPLR